MVRNRSIFQVPNLCHLPFELLLALAMVYRPSRGSDAPSNDPSPVTLRLMKTPAARHPLPKGEGCCRGFGWRTTRPLPKGEGCSRGFGWDTTRPLTEGEGCCCGFGWRTTRPLPKGEGCCRGFGWRTTRPLPKGEGCCRGFGWRTAKRCVLLGLDTSRAQRFALCQLRTLLGHGRVGQALPLHAVGDGRPYPYRPQRRGTACRPLIVRVAGT